jgi:hypothetical protein
MHVMPLFRMTMRWKSRGSRGAWSVIVSVMMMLRTMAPLMMRAAPTMWKRKVAAVQALALTRTRQRNKRRRMRSKR